MSLHIPWDKADPKHLKAHADAHGLGFDAMNSNTFSDAPDQAHSYKYGSLSHVNAATRAQAIEHNIECIEIGRAIGSKALTVWIGDGSNYPGQSNFAKSFERYLGSMAEIYKALPDNWHIFSEHKMYEPAFYSTVVQDWGTNFLIAQTLGPKAYCLVDLGHHAPNTNIEMIVSRLIQFKKLGVAFISMIPNMAMMISTRVRSIPIASSSSSTNLSMRKIAEWTNSIPHT